MTVGDVKAMIDIVIIKLSHTFFANSSRAIDLGTPNIGYDVAENMVVNIFVILASVGERLSGNNAILDEEECDIQLVGNLIEELQINSNGYIILIVNGCDFDGYIGIGIDNGVDVTVDTTDGVEEIPSAGSSSAVDKSCGVLASSKDTEIVAPVIASIGAEVGIASIRFTEGTRVMDGDGKEFAVVLGESAVDSLVSRGAVYATYTSIFLNDGALAMVGDTVAVEPFSDSTRIYDIILLVNLVASGKDEGSARQ